MRTLIAATVACVGLALTSAPTAQADTFDEFYEAIDWLGNKYGVTVWVGQEPMAYGTYAMTQGDEIYLNSGYVNNPDIFARDIASDTISGWHRAAKCSPAQGIAAHEFAHALDNMSGRTAQAELVAAINSGLSGTISGYGVESPGEAIAESFAAVECDVPTPAEQAIYTMLVN